MSFTRVLYPPQPPTSNTLSAEERAQLVRSAKKLSKVLGTTPQLIDETCPISSPVHISLSIHTSTEKPLPEIVDSPVSDDLARRSPSISSNSTLSNDSSSDGRHSLSSSTSASSFADSVNSTDSWRVRKPTRKPPPLLRLASNNTPMQSPPSAIASVKPNLETIPASPPFVGDDSNASPQASPQTISFARFGAPASRPPSFEIPSEASIEASLRWAKMERLRKKLGDGVPASLVFDDVESSTELGRSSLPRSSFAADGTYSKPSSPLPGKSFSLERPLFAIVEGPDDVVVGCFEFGAKKERSRALGRRRG